MNKSKATNFVNNVRTSASKRKPEILMWLGITGMLTTTVLAVKDTPKALQLIEDARNEKGEDLTPVEKTKACWKCYIPAAVTGTLSVACLIGANSENARRTAALAAAYQLSETALSEYREKVVETIGEKKEQVVRDKINKDRVEKNPASQNTVIITEKGNTLCFDPISGRYFRSDIDKIKRAQNKFNKDLLDEMYKSLNEFYDEIDLDHIDMGDDLGWLVDKGLVDISFSSQIADDGTPCIVIDHHNPPHYNYSKIY